MFTLYYLPSHECNKPKGLSCFCEQKGFTSPKMAAIYAYHHLRCNGCRKEQSAMAAGWDKYKESLIIGTRDNIGPEEVDFYKSEFKWFVESDTLEDKWYACTCSSEWIISKIDGDDE